MIAAPATLRLRNPALLETLSPFLVATPENVRHFDLGPFGLAVDAANVFDPLHTRSEAFLDLLGHLDVATFGPEGMPMPRWVFFNGAELTGGIFGLGCPHTDVSDAARALLQVPDAYSGLVPFAMYIALPTFDPDVWVGHNLASAGPLLPDERLKGLGGLTKALGLKCFRTKRQLGATQWDSAAIYVHSRMGPLGVLTAWTPGHSEPWTLTYAATTDDGALRNLAHDLDASVAHPEPDFWVESDDHAEQQRLQDLIEAGQRFELVGPPESLGSKRQRIPIRQLP